MDDEYIICHCSQFVKSNEYNTHRIECVIELCQFCNKICQNSQSLKRHQKRSEKCMKKRDNDNLYNCTGCNRQFTLKKSYDYHVDKCVKYYKDKIEKLNKIITQSENIIKEKDNIINHLKGEIDSITYNNLYNSLVQITDDFFSNMKEKFHSNHLKEGLNGVVDCLIELFDNKLICKDKNELIFEYKNTNNQIIQDIELKHLWKSFCYNIYPVYREYYENDEYKEQITSSYNICSQMFIDGINNRFNYDSVITKRLIASHFYFKI